METKLQKHITQLKSFNTERRYWLIASGFVILAVLGIIFGWNYIITDRLFWLFVSIGLTITVSWWYWTMRLIRHLIESKQDEYAILSDLVSAIQEIKEDVKKLN